MDMKTTVAVQSKITSSHSEFESGSVRCWC